MCEVTIKNFNSIYSELEKVLQSARIISLDTEFSCLTASQKLQNSLFDSAHERYSKLRATVEQMIPIQVGISAFVFDPDNNSYVADVYTFYVFPRSFSFLDTKFICQSSSFQFLSTHKFDFNKFVNEGVSFLNRVQEDELTKSIKNNFFAVLDSSMPIDIDNVLEESGEIIAKWIYSAKDGDVLTLTNIEALGNNLDIKYFLHKGLRSRFKDLWTFEDSEGFKVQKTTPSQLKKLEKDSNLDETLICNLLGFTKVFRLLTSLKKPIIGHNLLLDLMVMVHHFEKPLPKCYSSFKKLAHALFPTIYDTKCISFDITSVIPETKRWRQNTLQHLYEYFKNGHGRHLSLSSPLIEPISNSQQHFHYAGWDSYCTGYIFIRMAHVYATQRSGNIKGKKFMSSELIQAVSKFKNSVNIIRGDVSHIQLDGEDPVSKRPPWLIVETNSRKPLNINEVISLLSTYGFVEVKPYSFKRHRAIVAVDNFGSAKRILKQFKAHSGFRIQQYNVLKHSPIARAVLWGGVFVTGTVLVCYGYLKIK